MIFEQGRYRIAILSIILGLNTACSQPPTPAPKASDSRQSASASPSDNAVSQQSVEPAPPVNAATFATYESEGARMALAGNRLGLDIYQQQAAQPGNLFFSPYSLSTALTMTYAGARNKTAVQMAATLHLPDGNVHAAAAELKASLTPKADSYELRIANRLWAQEGLALQDDFLMLTRDYYAADVGLVNFEQAVEQARKTINDWIELQTNQKIVDLLPRGSIDSLARLILTNAIYFKGNWQHQFDKGRTQDAPFYGSVERRVPMMQQSLEAYYAETPTMQLLRLPYVGDALSMLILLPRDRNGLATLERDLTINKLQALLSEMQSAEVDVWLPRFKASSHFELSQMLKKLGMTDAFVPEAADFSGIDGKKRLYIKKAIHKAFVEVNEEGSEAAAATAVVLGVESVRDVYRFRADHPFVFMIRDDRSGAILFLGRLVDPAA